MNIIKCPKCGSVDLNVYNTEGGIEEGRIVEITECMNCEADFEVKAELFKVEIE